MSGNHPQETEPHSNYSMWSITCSIALSFDDIKYQRPVDHLGLNLLFLLFCYMILSHCLLSTVGHADKHTQARTPIGT